jgi:hypothetical protein
MGMNVNKYRDLARRLIHECSHPELTRARKLVLLKLADLIDERQGYTAYPAFNTLAEFAAVSRDTAIRAVGKRLGLLVRVKGAGKRGLGGTTNRYGFRLKEVADVLPLQDVTGQKEVAGVQLKKSQACIERGSRRATQQSNDHLIDSLITREAPPSSSGLKGHSSVVALKEANSANAVPSGARSPVSNKEGVGERSEPFPWIDIALGSATQIYSAPIVYDEYGRPPEWIRRRQVENWRKEGRANSLLLQPLG